MVDAVPQQSGDQEKVHVNAQQMMDMVVAYFAEGKYEDVEKLCLKLLAWRDDHAPAWYFRGLAAQAEDRHEDALSHLEKASGASEIALPRSMAIGKSHFALGDIDSALKAFQRTLDLQADNAEGHYYLAMALKAKGDLTSARTYLRRATLLDPSLGVVWFELGNIGLLVEKHEEAVKALDKAAKLLPDAPEVHNNLGLAKQAAGDMAGAEVAYGAALKLAPEYAEAHANMGLLLSAVGRDGEGRQHLDAALKLKPELREHLPTA